MNSKKLTCNQVGLWIAGKPCHVARRLLDEMGFTCAEASEIVAAHSRRLSDTISADIFGIGETVRSTRATSARIGKKG